MTEAPGDVAEDAASWPHPGPLNRHQQGLVRESGCRGFWCDGVWHRRTRSVLQTSSAVHSYRKAVYAFQQLSTPFLDLPLGPSSEFLHVHMLTKMPIMGWRGKRNFLLY